MQMLRIKMKFFLKLLLVFSILYVSSALNLYASEPRTYYYIQYNIKFNVINTMNSVFSSYNEETQQEEISYVNTKLKPLVPFFNGSMFLGYHFASNYSLEFELAEHNVHYDEVNGVPARAPDASLVNVAQTNLVISLKKDLFDIGNQDNTIYTKIGVGLTEIDFASRDPADGGNAITPMIQAGIGYTYVFNRYVDFDVLLSYDRNFSKLEIISSYSQLGIEANVEEVGLFLGLRVKI